MRIGKLATWHKLCENFSDYPERYRFTPRPISVEHGRLAGQVPGVDKVPSDRMFVAQALVESVPLAADDPAFATFSVDARW